MRDAIGKGLTLRRLDTMVNHQTNEVFFDNLKVPAENLIGEEDHGFRYILDGMNAERILVSGESLGDARYFIDRASTYSKERVVFGRPIGQNQAIQFPIARAYAEWKAADLVTRAAAALFDAGRPCGEEANTAKLLGLGGGVACGRSLHADLRRLCGGARIRHRAQMARMPAGADRADLDQPHPGLYRPARARHAALVLTHMCERTGRATKQPCLNAPGRTHESMLSAHVRVVRATLVLLAAAGGAQAQNYPSRPITIVAPFPPGASTDFIARLCASRSSEALGQPVVIENRPGAGGTTGTAAVANAAPDGHTLLVSVNAPVTMNMYMQKNFPFDPKTAFAPIVTAADVVMTLAVNAKLPVKNVAELIDYAKKNPGQEAELRQRRHRLRAPYCRRTAQAEDRHRHGARTLSRRRPGDPGSGGGAYPDQLRHHAGGAAAGARRNHPHHRAGGGEAQHPICRAFRPSPRPFPASSPLPGSACSRRPARRSRSSIAINAIIADAIVKPDFIAKLKTQGATVAGGTPEDLQ